MTARTPDAEAFVTRWNPAMKYIVQKRDIEAWYDAHGSFGLYDGAMWEPKATKLIGDRYEVTFVRRQS